MNFQIVITGISIFLMSGFVVWVVFLFVFFYCFLRQQQQKFLKNLDLTKFQQ